MDGIATRKRLPAANREIDIGWVNLQAAPLPTYPLCRQQCRARPGKVSSTIWPRRVQSLMASAIMATGLTVGWPCRSSSRPFLKVLAPA